MAGRIVLTAAGLLCLVVLALSIVLSAVITGRLTEEALDRASSQMERDITELTGLRRQAQFLAGVVEAPLEDPNVGRAVQAGDMTTTARVVTSGLERMAQAGDQGIVALVLPAAADAGRVLLALQAIPREDGLGVVPERIPPDEEVALAASPIVLSALIDNRNANGFQPLGGDQILALGSAAYADPPGQPVLAAVVAFRIDASLLARLSTETRNTYLVTAVHVVGPGAETLPDAVVERVRREVIGVGRDLRIGPVADDSRYTTARALTDPGGREIAAIVVTESGALVEAARRDLFRVLFVTALAGVLVALALSVAAGARIAAPLRALTAAARRLRAGDLRARSGVRTADEVGALGIAFDEMAAALQDQAAALATAADEESRLRRQVEGVIMSMNDGVVAVDLDGNVTAVNRAAEELLGRPSPELIGTPVTSAAVLVGPGEMPIGEWLHAPGPPWAMRVGLVRSGQRIPVTVSRSSITDEQGRPIGGVVVLRDVSEEETLERMKSSFLANVSHELRTPLTPIKGYASLLAERSLTPSQQREFVSEITLSASRLERIVSILIDFAELEAGRFQAGGDLVDVADLARSVAAAWDGRSDRHQVKARVSGRLPPVVGDAGALSRALLELVDNGVKYSPNGGTVEIRAASGNGKVLIEVSDPGIGFDMARLPEFMQEFTQADTSSTRRFGGLGLGLPFVKRIAEAHGGRVIADSQPGEGSRFIIELPSASAVGPLSGGPVPAPRSGEQQ